jgi:outer membrane receptor for ferrienterochelin and colicins
MLSTFVPRPGTLAVSMALLAMLRATAQAQSTPVPASKVEPAPKEEAKPVQKVEVKGAAADYDPRRDDTASKTVLNAEEIRKYGDDNIYDVLKRAPGVTVTGKTLRMRGLGAGYTQILVNGDRPPPGFSLDALTPDQIERIEIVRAATAEFSMQAIAGTINIVLRKVVSKPQRDLRMSAYGSGDSKGVSAGGTLGDKKGDLSWFLNAYLYGGRNENETWSADRFTVPSGELLQSRETRYGGDGGYRGAVLFPRLSWKLADGDQLNLSAGLQATRSDWRGGSRNDNLVGTFPAPDYVETLQGTPTRQAMGSLEVNWVAKLAGGRLDLTLSGERSRNTNDSLNDLYTEGRAQRLLRDWDSVTRAHRASLRSKYTRSLFDGHSMTAGLEGSVQKSEETRDRQDRVDAQAPTRLLETFAPEIARLAGFVQDEWNVSKQFSLYMGARWEGVQTDSETTGMADTRSRNHVLSPVGQALYKLAGGRQLRLALTRTYKAPTVQQLTARRYESAVNTRFNADSGGNPDLRPELANGIDVSYEHFMPEGATVSASASRRAISDYIRTRLDLDENGRWVYRPLNDGDALVRSLQLEAKLPDKALAKLIGPMAGGLDLRASFSRNWSEVSSVPGPGNRLDAQTPMLATLGADWRKGSLTLGSSLAWQQGGWVRVSDAQSRRQQSRRDLDGYLLWKLDAHYQLRFSVNNLLGMDNSSDQVYEDAAGSSRELSFQRGYARANLSLEMKL